MWNGKKCCFLCIFYKTVRVQPDLQLIHNPADNPVYSLCVFLAGLFHRGISQSGTALCSWALAANGSSSHQAKKLASLLDCPTSPTVDLVECLRTKNARDIIATDKQFMVCYVFVIMCIARILNLLPEQLVVKRSFISYLHVLPSSIICLNYFAFISFSFLIFFA
jgi:hypothetical protein